MKRPTSRPP